MLYLKLLILSILNLHRQTRNAYSSKLLQILQNYEPLTAPFNEKPPLENLKPMVNFQKAAKKAHFVDKS